MEPDQSCEIWFILRGKNVHQTRDGMHAVVKYPQSTTQEGSKVALKFRSDEVLEDHNLCGAVEPADRAADFGRKQKVRRSVETALLSACQ